MTNRNSPQDTHCHILNYIILFNKKHGYPPSVREIMEELGLQSTSATHYHLANMEKLGLITHTPGVARSIRVIAVPNNTGYDRLAMVVNAANGSSEGMLALSKYLAALQKQRPMSVAEWLEYLRAP